MSATLTSATIAPYAGARILKRRDTPFSPLTSWATQPHSIFWADDPSWSNPGDGNAVSTWRNAGSNGTAAVQAVALLQPTFRAAGTGLNGHAGVQGDGTADTLATAAFTSIPQPYSIVAVGSISSAAAAAKFLYDSISGANEAAFYVATAGTKFSCYAGVGFDTDVGVDTNVHMSRVYWNGASSAMAVDETSKAGNAGASAITGITIGSAAGGAAGFNAGTIGLLILYPGQITADASWAAFKVWCAAYYGLTLS